MEMRMQAADTIFFLDLPTEVCLSGIRARRGKPRSDMPWIETEEDDEFVQFIEDYNTVSRPKVLELLSRYGDREIVVFGSREDMDAYLL